MPSNHRRSGRRHALSLALLLAASAACSSASDAPTAPVVAVQRTPCTGGATVVLGTLENARIDCTNGGTTVTLPGNGASYLVVPEFVTDQPALDQLISYRLFADNPAAGTISPRVASPVTAAARLATTTATLPGGIAPPSRAQQAADRFFRSKDRVNALRAMRAPLASPLSPTPAFDVLPGTTVPATGSLRAFHVLSSFTTNTYANVTARLAFVGSNVLLYVDTLAPSGGFTSSQLQAFGQYFDQALYTLVTQAFGSPTDVDQNGHVIMLMTPTVNADTPKATCNGSGYVAGFFDSIDFGGATVTNSNQGEVFYSIVPDPAGTVSCAHTVDDVGNSAPATFVHELQHLINFSEHVAVSGGEPGASWLDEGMSIVAEELGSLYHEQKCPPPSCRTNASQLFPDSAQGFVSGFLYDSYQYALLPDTASITMGDDSQDGFSWRGGAWLLSRWLGDQYGSPVYQKLEHGPSNGISDIQQATGANFNALFGRFGVSLYTDSIPGLARTAVSSSLRFSTRNLRQLWARLDVTSGGAADVPNESPLLTYPVSRDSSLAVLLPGTTTYFRLNTPAATPQVTMEFSGPGGTAFNPALGAQLAIFRLP